MSYKEERLGLFTASRISELLQTEKNGKGFGDKALTYINDILSEILTGETKEESYSKQTEWGLMYEPLAMEKYIERYGAGEKIIYYGQENPTFFSLAPNYQCGGSPDGMVEEKKVIEIKCPYRTSRHIENLRMNLEEFKVKRKEYYAQIQLNMVCTKTTVADFVSFDPRILDDKLAIRALEVPIDYDYTKHLLQRITDATSLTKKIYKELINNAL